MIVLRYCIDNAIKPFCIYNGTKIMYMAVVKYNVRFVDSINYVNAALETFPKTFGFSELKKGYFPHLFNTPENQAYVGSIPPKYYYDPGHMKPTQQNFKILARIKFLPGSYFKQYFTQIKKFQENYS